LPNAHPLWQLGEGQPHLKLKIKKRKKTNLRFNVLDEGSPFKMKVLHKKIKDYNTQ
jgi:hypothetical protein